MNNLRKTAVLLFIGVFMISMALVPFTPMANVESQVAAPTNYERDFVEKWAERLENEMPSEKMDPVLASYMETGTLDENVATTRRGDTKLLVYLEPTFDASALASIAKVRWKFDAKLLTVASVEISSTSALKQLEAMDGIQYVQADMLLKPEPVEENDGDRILDMFNIRDVVGATGTYATDYDGSGVVVGVMDSGVDFTQEDMRNANTTMVLIQCHMTRQAGV